MGRELLYRTWLAMTRRRAVLHRLAQLRRVYASPREALEADIRRRLASMLQFAAEQVPYYREIATQRGLTLCVDSIYEDLRRLPILTKNIMRREFQALKAPRPGRGAYRNTSGGSTGEPVVFLQDRDYQDWAAANKLLFASWLGHSPGDPLLKIWGAPKDIFGDGAGASLKNRLRAFMLNERILNCYLTNRAAWERFRLTINGVQPTLIESYADAADELAGYLIETGLDVHPPRGIITSAGLLTDPMRERIHQAFGCDVLNRYGSREVGDIACSSPGTRSLHVCEWTHHVEIVDENGDPCGPDVQGDVVITLLTNRTMPLIRFRIGDRATWSQQVGHGGLNTRMLRSVDGRRSDYLIASNGTRINGTALTTLLYGTPGVGCYQFRQTSRSRIDLCVVPAEGADTRQLEHGLKNATVKLRTLFGGDMEFDVSVVPHIERTATGKHLYIINDLARN